MSRRRWLKVSPQLQGEEREVLWRLVSSEGGEAGFITFGSNLPPHYRPPRVKIAEHISIGDDVWLIVPVTKMDFDEWEEAVYHIADAISREPKYDRVVRWERP